jgi:16S rRNA (uracil1498-N3)-methyltransferase
VPGGEASSDRRSAPSNTYRFFVEPTAIRGSSAVIADHGLVHQIADVLRLGPGNRIVLLDNGGWEYTAVLDTVERGRICATVEQRQPAGGEPALHLTLYVALLKGDRFEWMLQKGTELGVSAFVPLVADRSVGTAGEIGSSKLERWQRIVREAAEQSRRGRVPPLQAPQNFDQACAQATPVATTLLLWEGNGIPGIRTYLRSMPPQPGAFAIFSGPEGGWSEDELATASGYNVAKVSLGPRILRAETAPLVATTALLYESGDLD